MVATPTTNASTRVQILETVGLMTPPIGDGNRQVSAPDYFRLGRKPSSVKCHSERVVSPLHAHRCGSANAVSALPAGTSRYCRPSSMYVVPDVDRIWYPIW